MTPSPTEGDEPLEADDLRHFESWLNAKLQEISARLVLNDSRFAALTDRLNLSDRRAEAFDARITSCFDTVDRRLDKREARIAKMNDRAAGMATEVTDGLNAADRFMRRFSIVALAMTSPRRRPPSGPTWRAASSSLATSTARAASSG